MAGVLAYLLAGPVDIGPTTEPIRLLPLALIPTGPVPLAVALHIVALTRLRTAVPRAAASTA